MSFRALGKRSKPQVQQLERLVMASRGRQLQGMTDISTCRQKEADISQQSVIAQQLCTTTRRQMSWFTVARRLHKGGLFAFRPERCLPLKVGHRLQWCREHRNWTIDQ
ncbi:transposable element Tcb2 transposase [Trichonephila clavipes]|nr:transposable element Tcb2 transposase [Trichonephila clavipes]